MGRLAHARRLSGEQNGEWERNGADNCGLGQEAAGSNPVGPPARTYRKVNMKKIALLLAVLATLALAGVASAATPQGNLTGAAVLSGVGITQISITSPVSDGEQVNVAKNNDNSGDCDGDSGAVSAVRPGFTWTVSALCVHFTGTGMAFEFADIGLGTFVVVFIRDGGASPDKVYVGSTPGVTTADQTLAKKWVNLGWKGSGAKVAGLPFPQATIVSGGFTVTA